MSKPVPERILVIDDNPEIHVDFRKILAPESNAAVSYDAAAATLFRRKGRPKATAALQLDFAKQGQEGLACVRQALEDRRPYAMAFIDMRMPPGWDGLETITQIWNVQPALLVVICTAFSDYSWEEISERLGESDRLLILKKPFDNVEVRQFAHALTARAAVERTLSSTQQELLEVAREAGMVEVATGVLHNVGNVLNSVNVSVTLVAEQLRKSKMPSLAKAVLLLSEHEKDVGHYLASDPKGRQLLPFLKAIAEELTREQAVLTRETQGLQENVAHIKQVVSMQQSYAKVSGAIESLPIHELVEDALRISSTAMICHEIEVVREIGSVPPVLVDRHKVLQILINLINNAKHALDESSEGRRLTVRITSAENGRARVEVTDNGIGIPHENLPLIFKHGFSTKKTGHGFGLHTSAKAATEMGGSLNVRSDGPGAGATFVLELPLSKDRR